MSKIPILSLCVLTYNQPKSVEQFFKSVSQQLTDEVEILIRDDSPNDETELIVKKYASEIKIPVRYLKGEKSKFGGYDKALLAITKEARGEYLWWYGDDIMAPDAISRIIKTIKKNPKLSFIWLNSRDINNAEDQSLDFGGDRYFNDGNEIFNINVGLLGFPSATLLKREEALTGVKAAKKFIGTTLTGYYLVLHIISQKDKLSVFIQDPCLFCNPKPMGEVRWYDSFQVHGLNYFIIAQDFKNRFDKKIFTRALAKHYGSIWRAVIVERALGFTTGFGAVSPKVWKMTKLYWSYPEYYIAMPLMLVPRFILTAFYKTYIAIRKLQRAIWGSLTPSKNISSRPELIVCPHDKKSRLVQDNHIFKCTSCNNNFQFDDGVIRILDKTDNFYESTYEGQIAYVPKSEMPWHTWPLWLINSGYLWSVRKYVPAGKTVVELGCAGGVKYFGMHYKMIGCDISFSSLKKLKGVYSSMIQTDVTVCIPLPDQSVDAVVSSFFWEHMNPEVKPKILQECARILKPSGKIIFLYDVETKNPLIDYYKKLNPKLYEQLFIEGDGHIGYQRPRENVELFNSAGYHVLEQSGLEKTWIQSASTYSKIVKFSSVAKGLFAWTWILNTKPWFYIHTLFMRLIDSLICPLLPDDWARTNLVVCEINRIQQVKAH